MEPMNLSEEFAAYKKACYGDRELPAAQEREIEQAFLSGIHVLNEMIIATQAGYAPGRLNRLLQNRLMELGRFPTDGN